MSTVSGTPSNNPLEYADLEHGWERVRENDGCAGADGVTVEFYSARLQERLTALYKAACSGTYRPYPLLEIRVEKKPGSPEFRRLLVPAVADRILETAAAAHLSRSFEDEFLECSFAYRPGRGVDRAIARIRWCRDQGYRFVVDADIHAFFDEVAHDLLLRKLAAHVSDPALMELLERWIRASYWDGTTLKPLSKGIPQGSPISPLLANLFLQEFDLELEKTGRKLIRYSDDFIILSRTPDEASAALREAGELLANLQLELKLEKTRVTSFDDGFRFLGVLFDKDAIWVPWKQQRQLGRVLFMARRMPPAVLRRWERDALSRRPRKPAARSAAHSATQPDTPRNVRERRTPDMAFLYITEQGSVLRKSGDRFLVEKDDQVLLDLPYHKLEHVVLFGNIQVTAQAMGELLDKGVRMSLFSRHGAYRGALSSPRGGDIALRLAQFRLHEDSTRVMDTARACIQAKISNGLDFLAAYRKSYGAEAEWDEERDRFAAAIQEAAGAVTLPSLEGVEGAAARRYFELLMRFNRSPFKWQGRIRHPSPDPLNGLLSLTYTLVGHELAALSEGVGLDPYLGCLHQPDYGRASLAQDLLEAFRHPLADRLVMALVNRAQFQPEDFRQDPNGGCFLAAEALKRYFMEYEKWMLAPRFDDGKPWRRIVQAEVERYAQAVRTASQFHPFTTAKLKGPGELNPEEICATSSVTI